MKKYERRSPNASQPQANSEELRPVFAAYLNMARANIFIVLRHISMLCGLKVDKNEEHMDQLAVSCFTTKVQHDEVKQRVYVLLYKHFPCLQQMAQAFITKAKPDKNGNKAVEEHKTVTHEDLQKLLLNILYVINYQRNDFTHADHYNTLEERDEEFEREAYLARPLSQAFIGSKREVKRIFQYSEEDMYFVDQDERMERTSEKNEEGKPIYKEHEDWFYKLITKSQKYIRNDQGDSEIFNENEISDDALSLQLTTAGLVFLICKFLEKNQATQFVKQVGIFRGKGDEGCSPFSDRENEIMFNIFCAHRIRKPKGRVESDSIALDMLNELQKCPKELFDTFSPSDRKLFQVTRNEEDDISRPDNDITMSCRYNDRFTQFALKYIDTFKMDKKDDGKKSKDYKDLSSLDPLPEIVFQIALGKYRYKFYDRISLDTNTKDRVRVLQKEINGFGPIYKVEALRNGEIKTGDKNNADTHVNYSSLIRHISADHDIPYNPDTAETKPYLTDHQASYAITGNRIGLMWGTKKENGILDPNTHCFLPQIPSPQKDKEGKWYVDMSSFEHNEKPRAWLSIYDLPALIFLHILGGNPQVVIFKKYKSLRKLFSDIQKGKLTPIYTGQLNNDPQKRKKQAKRIEKQCKIQLSEIIKSRYDGIQLCDIPQKMIEYLIWGNLYKKEEADKSFLKWADRKLFGNPKEKRKGIIQRLSERIKKFDQDIEIVGDKKNRLGRKGYIDVRPGSLARYLSKDIVALTLPDSTLSNGGKPTGLDFAVLQSSIATFVNWENETELAKTSLGMILQKAIDVNKHPFLKNIMNLQVKDTVDLFKRYQKAKLAWLKERSKTKDYTSNEYFMYYMREAYRNHMSKIAENVLSHDAEDGTHIKGIAERYLDTLQLPDGLFTDEIRKQLAVNEETRDNPNIKRALDDEVKGHSASYLLYMYFTKVMNDKPQSFYRNQGERYKRHYKLFDTLFKDDNNSTYLTENEIALKLKKGDSKESKIRSLIEAHIANLQIRKGSMTDPNNPRKRIPLFRQATEEEREEERVKVMHQLRDLQRNEQTIRRFRNEDILLFLMAKKIILASSEFEKYDIQIEGLQNYKLQDIVPLGFDVTNESLLEQPIDVSVTFGLYDENVKKITDSNGKQIKRTVEHNNIKIKNYGEILSRLNDSRIGGLLSQLPEEDIVDYTDLIMELSSYDQQRLKVFSIVQAIERAIINQHPELADSNANGPGFIGPKGKPYRNSFSSLLTLCKQYLKTEGVLNDLGCSLDDVRNAFSHNRYTDNDNKCIDISKMTLPQIAALIVRWLEKQK